ncbi:carboxypeptidase-like regulatory domain-containing protein [Crossiella sp. SN42]|uniref:carboxypeptidase-like regulatory domain-containing protein n=1 Tax=Crossiella sp. SN42 TaxID=2944808 RepID=UPI00207D27AA|nr:carboxypeptidase-like regulatory domain-containing protein [Crossiella sp. SN42]MCO1575594.1 carboxypeptidase-like regulatory domain-containing protein [Crossiella sp. SN42]
MYPTLAAIVAIRACHRVSLAHAHEILCAASPLCRKRITFAAIRETCRVLNRSYDALTPLDRAALHTKALSILTLAQHLDGPQFPTCPKHLELIANYSGSYSVLRVHRHSSGYEQLTVRDDTGRPIATAPVQADNHINDTIRTLTVDRFRLPTTREWFSATRDERVNLTVRALYEGYTPDPCYRCDTLTYITHDGDPNPYVRCEHIWHNAPRLNPDHVNRSGGHVTVAEVPREELQDPWLPEDAGATIWFAVAYNRLNMPIGAAQSPSRAEALRQLRAYTPPPF